MNDYNDKKILVLAAHPDDETLGCGATLAKLAHYGAYIKLITFTDGVSSRDQFDKDRIDVVEKTCKLLGIKEYVTGNFPDNEIDKVSLLSVCKFIEKNTNDFAPDIIFTHHPDCLNIDHELVYRATITSFRPQPNCNVKQIYCYHIPSSTDYNPLNNFQANSFFDIEQFLNIKIKVLEECYPEEMRDYPHTRSIENVINLAKVSGSKVGLKMCEEFQLIRFIS